MCGIFAVASELLLKNDKNAQKDIGLSTSKNALKNTLYDGLEKLAYRGYDSAGIALLGLSGVEEEEPPKGRISVQKTSGKLPKLKPLLDYLPDNASAGIAHTRWATHGPATSINAHPHRVPGLAMVHNGIIENYMELKEQQQAGGITLISQTDTEVALAYLSQIYKDLGDLQESVFKLVSMLKGCFSFALLSDAYPAKVFLVKMGSPLVVGFGEGVSYCASDVIAFHRYTSEVVFLEDGDVGVLSGEGYKPLAGPLKERHGEGIIAQGQNTLHLSGSFHASSMGEYSSFMYKEICEQPKVLGALIARLYHESQNSVSSSQLSLHNLDLARVTHIHIVGCGSAYFAAALGKYIMEAQLCMPAHAELASEYRYRAPIITPHTLVIAVSQSGETADTLACVEYASKREAQVYAITNAPYSSIVRSSTTSFLMDVGREIGVASTKAFTAQVLSLFFLAAALAQRKGLLLPAYTADDLKALPLAIQSVLDSEVVLVALAKKLHRERSCLFVGRHLNAWIAYEGALKLKEISYIHAEAYPAGELKHGPLALVDANMCVIAMASKRQHFAKMLSNIEEIKARGGRVFAFASCHDAKLAALSEELILLPQLETPLLQSLVYAVALQILAYHTAIMLGHDVDQPRNLAKSVTVE